MAAPSVGKKAVRARPDPSKVPVQPFKIYRFVWNLSARDQVFLSLLAVAVFLLGTVPLELQRRIVNGAIEAREWERILYLGGAYAGVVLLAGLVKYAMNVYRGSVSERAALALRKATFDKVAAYQAAGGDMANIQGVEVSVVVAESDAVGGFVGSAFSEPLLEAGILLSALGYMIFIQPWMALVVVILFVPQLVFVPLLQLATNRRARDRIGILRQVSNDIITDNDKPEHDAGRPTFMRRIKKVYSLNLQIYGFKFGMNFLMNLLYQFSIVGVLVTGGWLVLNGQTELGTIVAFLSGLDRINDPWNELVNFYREWSVTEVKYALITDLHDRLDAAPAVSAKE